MKRRGWSLVDLMIGILVLGALLAAVIPVLGRMRGVSQIEVSALNLTVLSQASVMYAADWNGRQYTNINDELSSYGNNPSVAGAYFALENGAHPPVLLGWGHEPDASQLGLWGYFMDYSNSYGLLQPISFTSLSSFGMFRLINAVPFHQYVNGRFYDATFYAPGDMAPHTSTEPYFDEPGEFVPAYPVYWSSYCFSPAAMFNPAVMGANRDGVFQNPWSLPDGLMSPPLNAAAYPDLKTHILEHNWAQDPPATCNPAFPLTGTYDGCEPYYFNQGLDSAPVALFYDGHVRMLPNEEVLIADQTVLQQSGGGELGLWHRGTPFGADGYFIESGYDGAPLSHHILTTFGILGRDVLSSDYAVQSSARATNSTALCAKRHRPRPVLRAPGSDLIISAGP